MSTMPSIPPPGKPAPLFREQALAQAGAKQYGTVLLFQTRANRLIEIMALLLTLCLLALLSFASYTQKAPLHGVLRPAAGSGGQLEALAEVPAQFAARLHPGSPVSIRYAAYPFQQFGQGRGVVEQVELVPPADPDGVEAARYRAHIRLVQRAEDDRHGALVLQAGMAFDATARLETRRLYRWLLASGA
ncbi:hypothetical protein MJS38_28325, partial [Burkholderia gladioli]|uniref:hypothetical protein n=1 Tax=Burkholderia gladioli TaxID=28095 RepID=UPI000FD9BC88|nr:hypothetical protein [Burkholderia gladioli]TWC77755.1 hypothetical protein FB600_101166 [Burkholderia sp. SJZ089]TWD08801.1 hypothetical protein FBX98_101166 [Burkholderia sp. SJZ115]TWD11936.1 hypothetical protein FB601_101167 [Burkholderia sp. SJZ091]MBU9213863.1 hypothetical protein [Burkholderia gladioli]MDN7723853.1 hypothetical protein [Burkholderia gladioli]